MDNNKNKREYKIGLLCAIACAIIWGVLPIYWKMLESIDSLVIMLYRLILAFIFVLVICIFVYGFKEILEPLKNKWNVLRFFIAGLIISANWSIYIWAVNSGHVIQASIGYYIEPLLVCLLGMIIFREKLNKYKISAIILALAGVSVMIISYGEIPSVAIGLASTFAVYAVIKKKLQFPALLALLYETGLLMPIVIPVIIYLETTGKGVLASADPTQLGLLALAGVLTATPLLLFAMSANRIDLITLGITEYVSPTISLVLGIFMFNEPFDMYKLAGFALIWVGLAVFTVGGVKDSYSIESDIEKL